MVVETLTDEEGRLGALYRLGLPGVGTHEPLDRIVKIVQTALGVPMATISVLDRSHQTVLAARGIDDAVRPRAQSILSLAISQWTPLIIEDCANDPRVAMLGSKDIGAYLGVPLVSPEGYVLGCLEAMTTGPHQFSENDVTTAINLARLAVSYFTTRQIGGSDNLTGALTRRRFQSEVEREFARATRYQRPAALVFLDIDGFGEINSALGLTTADEVLKSVANRAMESLRSSDLFARIGGEEFGMLLPETLAYEASQCAERLREEIGRLRFRHKNGVLSVTASFGIAPLNPDIKSAADWFAKADIALYGAKQAGRNCVAFASPSDEGEQLPQSEGEASPLGRLH